MSFQPRYEPKNQLFIGRLPLGSKTSDVEDIFYSYGKLTRCDVKQAYGFVEYVDRRDAEDALRGENGRDFNGSTIVVEWSRRGGDRGGRGGYGGDRRDFRGGYDGRGGGGGGYRPRGGYHRRSRSRERYSPDDDRPRGRSPDYHKHGEGRSPDYGRRSPDYDGRQGHDHRSKRSPHYQEHRSRSRERY